MKVRALVVIVSVITIFVFLSCYSEGDVKTLSIEIPANIVCDRHPLDSLFDVDHFVILEETEESRVSQVSKIFVSSNEIAILDNTYKILFFSPEGKFLRKIQKLGHARDEYISLSDFDIKGDTLYLLDNMGKKILTYRKDGKCINSIDIEAAKGLKVLENGIAVNHEFGLADGSSNDYSYEYITKNEHIKEIEYNPYLTGRSFSFSGADDGFCEGENGIYYFIPYNRCIYAINRRTGKIQPWATIDFCDGNRTVAPNDTQEKVKEVLGSSVPSNIFSVYFLDKLLMFSYYSSSDERQYVFYDFENGTIHNSPLGFDKNRIPPMIVSYETDLSATKMMLCIVPSSYIKNSYESLEDKGSYQLLGEISRKITGQDNPVLIFYRLK